MCSSDLECGFMEEIVRHLYEHHRFALECAGSVLMGVCAECRTKMNDSEGAGDDGNVGYL